MVLSHDRVLYFMCLFTVTTVQANENDVNDEGILPASEGKQVPKYGAAFQNN